MSTAATHQVDVQVTPFYTLEQSITSIGAQYPNLTTEVGGEKGERWVMVFLSNIAQTRGVATIFMTCEGPDDAGLNRAGAVTEFTFDRFAFDFDLPEVINNLDDLHDILSAMNDEGTPMTDEERIASENLLRTLKERWEQTRTLTLQETVARIVSRSVNHTEWLLNFTGSVDTVTVSVNEWGLEGFRLLDDATNALYREGGYRVHVSKSDDDELSLLVSVQADRKANPNAALKPVSRLFAHEMRALRQRLAQQNG